MIDPDTVEFLPLNRGWKALVDADIYPELAKHKWYIRRSNRRMYAERHVMVNGKRKRIELHHCILTPRTGFTIDHKNANTPFCVLDERRANLRYATRLQQCLNRRKSSVTAGRFKGITRAGKKWQAQIQVNGKKRYLGVFVTEEGAASAYDSAALQYFGDFALVNVPKRKAE